MNTKETLKSSYHVILRCMQSEDMISLSFKTNVNYNTVEAVQIHKG